MQYLDQAVEAWKNVLGTDNVCTDKEVLQAARKATFATNNAVLAIIFPRNTLQVQKCVKIANMFKTALFPISTGKNWGYGSSVPVEDNCVIMNLSQMNNILDYNEHLGYLTIEPGVTQNQVFRFLRQNKSNCLLSITGSSMNTSIVGNIVERGFGSGHYADRFGYICGLEVIIPTGECIHTGFARFAHAQAAQTSRWGVGPYFDGIFTQSNLGIVTRMTIWLQRQPQQLLHCFFSIDDASQLRELIDTLQLLRAKQVFHEPVFLYNDVRLLSTMISYPWHLAGAQSYLLPSVITSLRKKMGVGTWNGLVSIPIINEQHSLLLTDVMKSALESKVDTLVLKSQRAEMAVNTSPANRCNFMNTPLVDLVVNHQKGIKRTYWKKHMKPPSDLDPDRDQCGEIWYAPSLPFDGQHVDTAIRMISTICHHFQFETHISLHGMNEREMIVATSLIYDREKPGEDEKALLCYTELFSQLNERGYLPYRLGIQSMNALPSPQDDYATLLSRIKTALDPNNILSPGRYDFRRDWPIASIDSRKQGVDE